MPDACTRLHAPRRGGAAAGLLSLPGRCRTRWRMWWMVRAMHERAVGGVNGLLARGWKESTSTHQKVRYSSSESRARVMRREVVSSKMPWADAADIGGDGLRMRAACGWCWGWCDCRRCPLCRWRRARDAGVVLEREDAWRWRAELEGLLESAAAQHVARSYRRCRAMR